MLHELLHLKDQDLHISEISPDWNVSQFYWITKNVDLADWELADSRTLLISAPPGHGMTEVCSHIIEVRKQQAHQTNSSVLYFFGSTATESMRSTVFTHTLLDQIIREVPELADSIATAFLITLLGAHFHRSRGSGGTFEDSDSLEMTMTKILAAQDNTLIEALVEAVKTSRLRNLFLIADGLSEELTYILMKYIGEATLRLKAIYTSRQRFERIPDGILYIEYDKERKGVNICP